MRAGLMPAGLMLAEDVLAEDVLAEDLLAAPVLDPPQGELDQAARVTYLLQQSLRYDYPAPIQQLRQRLVVLPPAQHGGQRLRARRLDVLGPRVRRQTRSDSSGNTVVRLQADRVERCIEFRVQAVIERVNPDGGPRLPLRCLTDPRLLRATRLTGADDRLRELAAAVPVDRGDPSATADAVCRIGAFRIDLRVRRDLGPEHRRRSPGRPVVGSARTRPTSCWRCVICWRCRPATYPGTCSARAAPTPGSRCWSRGAQASEPPGRWRSTRATGCPVRPGT